MIDVGMDVLGLAQDFITSPWIYAVIFVITVVDSIAPLLPSETLVITAAVFAGSGNPHVFGVLGSALAGAVVGDHLIYWFGRGVGPRLIERLRRHPHDSKKRRLFTWTRRELDKRGGPVLIIARYVPGARTMAALTMGAVGFRHRHFTTFTVIAGTMWASVSVGSGYLGGRTFRDNPLLALAVGFGVALVLAGVIEGLRKLRSGNTDAEPGVDPLDEPVSAPTR